MEKKRTSQIMNNGITILVYGQSGVGKTTLIKTLPGKVLILSAEAGLLSLRDTDIEYVDIHTMDDLTEAYTYIVSNITEYNCIVLDSLSEIGEVILANEKKASKLCSLCSGGRSGAFPRSRHAFPQGLRLSPSAKEVFSFLIRFCSEMPFSK